MSIFEDLDRHRMELELRKVEAEYQRSRSMMRSMMGASLCGHTQQPQQLPGYAYTPPPPPKVVYVGKATDGTDHPWSPWVEAGENGLHHGYVYRDLFIPGTIFQDIVIDAVRAGGPVYWDRMSLEEKREYVYLEARKKLITEG